MYRSVGKYGRGRGESFRINSSVQKSVRSQKKQIGTFRSVRRNVSFDPKEFLVAQCSVHDVEVYKQVFDFLDEDNDGMLTPLDLRKNMIECGYKPGRAFVYVTMSVFDADNAGQITFKQFVKLMTQKPYENDSNEDIERIFQYFDEDNKGYISPEDILACAEELHQELTLEEAKQMIRYCDPNGDGSIGVEAFVKFNKRKSFE